MNNTTKILLVIVILLIIGIVAISATALSGPAATTGAFVQPTPQAAPGSLGGGCGF